VDAALIRLAAEERSMLLTDDERTLAVRAWDMGIDCHLVKTMV
jgi:hypothetical protein